MHSIYDMRKKEWMNCIMYDWFVHTINNIFSFNFQQILFQQHFITLRLIIFDL